MRCGLTNLELTPDNRTQGRMNILIIPEDFRKDQYLLRPLFRQLFKRIGRSSAKVTVCSDPLLGGVREALKSERLKEIVEQYDGMVDMFILCVDRDGKAGRQQRLDGIESEFGIERSFLASNAWEELDTCWSATSRSLEMAGCSCGSKREGALLRGACRKAWCCRRSRWRTQAARRRGISKHQRSPLQVPRGF